jgi:hypothetical protein
VSGVDCEGLIVVLAASLRTRVAVELIALIAPLLLLRGLLGLAALRERVIHTFALLSVEYGPHRL